MGTGPHSRRVKAAGGEQASPVFTANHIAHITACALPPIRSAVAGIRFSQEGEPYCDLHMGGI